MLCPSRGREIALTRMILSVRRTSDADVAVYIDNDEAWSYMGIDAMVTIGPQIGPCQSINRLASQYSDYDMYAVATDDCVFLTEGWDKWLLYAGRSLNGVGLVAPYTDSAPAHQYLGRTRPDFPCVTRGWINTMGCLCPQWGDPPGPRHYYWDVVLEAIAGDRIVYSGKDDMEMRHIGEAAVVDSSFDAHRALFQIAYCVPGWRKSIAEAGK